MAASSLVLCVRDALESAGVTAEHRVGLACSGGPDSTVLAHVVVALRPQAVIGDLILVHVDHGLRVTSGDDTRLVQTLADSLECACVVERVQVDRTRASLEQSARDARYQVFERVIESRTLDWMLLAHTASDQSETVLMRVIRGTGVPGLVGIPRVRDRYLRPLLNATRADIEAYADAHAVPGVTDASNRDPAFFRNRVRHRWLPLLREENPRIDESLRRLSRSAADHREVLDYASTELLGRATLARRHRDVRLDTPILAAAPASVARRALSMAVRAAHAGTRSQVSISATHLRALHDLVARPAAGTRELNLPRLLVRREYDVLILQPDAVRANAATDSDGIDRPSVQVSGPDAPYDVRLWQPGDRMRPHRLRGRSRKLSDLFIDGKVPRRRRSIARVVVRRSDGVIEWAEHIGAAWGARADVTLTSLDPGASNRLEDRR